MDQALRRQVFDYLGIASLITLITGIFFSRAAISIGMVAMSFYAVFLTDVKKNVRTFLNDRVSIGFAFIFLVILFSGINSSNHSYWLDRLFAKIPFLALPFAFCAYRSVFSKKNLHLVLLSYLLLAVLSSGMVLWNYLQEMNDVNSAYSRGGVMDTPFNHLRYSILIAFAIFIPAYFLIERILKNSWQRIFMAIACIYLIIFIHLLAVRTGLVAFYIGGIFMIYHFAFQKKRFAAGAALLSCLIALPIILFFLFPSMQGRLNYVQYDFNQYFNQSNAQHLSDASRIISLKKGWEITQQNWLFGIGMGDLQDAMRQRMQQASEQPLDLMLPLNEFLVMSAGCGIFGFLIFTFAVFQPFTDRADHSDWLTVVFLLFFIFSIITDAALEEQIGVAFYLTFLFLFHSYNHRHVALSSDHSKQ